MTGIMTDLLELTSEYGAHNYHPLPIVAAAGRGCLGYRRRRAPLPGHARRVLRR